MASHLQQSLGTVKFIFFEKNLLKGKPHQMDKIIELIFFIGVCSIIYLVYKVINKRKIAGSDLPKIIYPYYAQVLTILEPYNTEYINKIKSGARDQLVDDLKQYNHQNVQNYPYEKEQYYFDVAKSKNSWEYSAWAKLYIRYQLAHYRPLLYNESESRVCKQLIVYLDEQIKPILEDETICPRSFIDVYCVDWYYDYIKKQNELKNK